MKILFDQGVPVLSTTSWPRIRQCVETIRETVLAFKVNGYEEIAIQ